MATRLYSSISVETTLASGINSSVTSITVATGTATTLLGGVTVVANSQFTVAIDPDTINEEIVFITAGPSGDTFTVTRGRAGSSAVAHSTGATIKHVLTSDDLTAFAAGISPVTSLGFSGSTSGTTTVQATAVAGTNTLTLPATTSDTLVGKATTDTLTNKKLSDSTTTIVDATDTTKAVKFDVGGTTAITGTIATAFTTAKTLTLPDATDTLIGKDTTDTLTNKTLTSPVLTTPSISNINAKGDVLVGTADNTLGVLAVGTNGQVLTADSAEATGLKFATPTTSTNSASVNVDTVQATTSTSYTDLNTVQSVTLTTGTKAVVFLSAQIQNNAVSDTWASVAISGATTVTADDAYAVRVRLPTANVPYRVGAHRYFSSLTAGSNTFTMKFKATGGNTANFGDRTITVIDMGS
jgi:hypothetical protein